MRPPGLRAPLPVRAGLPDLIADAATLCVKHWRLLLPLALPSAILAGVGSYALLAASPETAAGVDPTAAEVQRMVRDALPWLVLAVVGRTFSHLALTAALLGLSESRSPRFLDCLRPAGRLLPGALLAFLVVVIVGSLLTATLLLIPVAVYLLVRWAFAPQVMVELRAGPFRAMSVSSRVTARQWWRTLRVGLAVLLLSLLPEFVVSQVAGALGTEEAAAIGAAIAALLGTPFVAAGLTLLYLDERRAKGLYPPAAPSEESQR